MHSLRGTFRTRNTHIVRAPRVVLLGREIHLLFGHLAWFPLEQGIRCAFPIDIPSSSRKMYRLVFWKEGIDYNILSRIFEGLNGVMDFTAKG